MSRYDQEFMDEVLNDESMQCDNDEVAEELLFHLWD